jgi:hypothetical protein
MIRQICRFQNRQKTEKNRPQKTKEAQNVVFNLIGFLYYFTVPNIFTDNLKLI